MWSLLNNLANRFIDRPRLEISAQITSQTDRPPYRFEGQRVLLVNIVNPTKDDIPVDKLTISVGGIPWILNPQLESDCKPPPCAIPAQGRCQFWMDALDLAETLIEEGWEGKSNFDVTVHLSTGKANRSAPVSIDLELFGGYISHRKERESRERINQFRRALKNREGTENDSDTHYE